MTETDVWRELGAIRDPELPVSIVDLGLVYGVRLSMARLEGRPDTHIDGAAPAATDRRGHRGATGGLPESADVVVTLVWDPPWSLERITGRAGPP